MSRKKVLVIDDEFPIRYLVEHQLSRNDLEVQTAKDGPTGLTVASSFQPDIIVLDVMMPGMDGFQVCEQLRQDPDLANTPVIFLTACMTRQHKMRAFKVGGNDYLVKPFQADELLAHIDAILDQGESDADAPEEAAPGKGRIVGMFSPKGGVGTSTLAIQLSEAIVIRRDQPVVLIDLDLPLGSIAPMLNLVSKRHIIDLLRYPPNQIGETLVSGYAQKHRSNLLVVPTPAELVGIGRMPAPTSLKAILDAMINAGYMIVMDLGSTLSNITIEGLRLCDVVYVVTSGKPVSNKLHNAFVASASELGLETTRLLPVVNELHGATGKLELSRMPVARIPHAQEKSRTKLWLRDQGMQKLVSITL